MKVFSCESSNSRHLSSLNTAETSVPSQTQTSFLPQHQTSVLSQHKRHLSCLNSRRLPNCCIQLLATRTLTLVPQLLSAFLQFCFSQCLNSLSFCSYASFCGAAIPRRLAWYERCSALGAWLWRMPSNLHSRIRWRMWIRSALLGLTTLIVTDKPHPATASQMILQNGTGTMSWDGRSTLGGCRQGSHQLHLS